MARIFWTTDKEEKLNTLFPVKNYSELASYFGVTEIAVRVKCKRLGLLKSNQFTLYGYISQNDLLKELKSKGIVISRDVLLSLRRCNIIENKEKANKKDLVYYPIETIQILVNIFDGYVLLRSVHHLFNHSDRHLIQNLVRRDPKIKYKKLDGYVNILIHKGSIDYLLKLESDYLKLPEFAKKVFYSVSGVHHLIKINQIKPIKLGQRNYIHKSYISKIKDFYVPRINKYK